MSSNVDRRPNEIVLTDDTVQYERNTKRLHMPRTMHTVDLMREDCKWLIDVTYQDNSLLFSIYHLAEYNDRFCMYAYFIESIKACNFIVSMKCL